MRNFTFLLPCLLLLQQTTSTVLRNRVQREPLNVQNAVDLDEMDVDISATASSTSNKQNIIMGSETSKSISRPRVASATVEGDDTVMPLSSTPIDMSVKPEPVPKVDGVDPSYMGPTK